MIWFTSDHHFRHTNIIKYTGRPFSSVREMDGELVARWNEKVGPGDEVYHIGDFTLGDIDVMMEFILTLNGRIHIVPGGHDHRWLDGFIASSEFDVLPPLYSLEGLIPKLPIVLCHYPMLSWDRSHYGSIHLHGHIHSKDGRTFPSADKLLPPKSSGGKNGRRLDVGVDAHDYYPISLDEVLELTNDK